MDAIPEGYMENSQGHLVPVAQVEDIDIARSDLVKEKVELAKQFQATLQGMKRACMGDVAAFLQMAFEKWEVKPGGKKGNVSLSSFDGKFKLLLAVQEKIDFDEQLQAAKALIDEYLVELSEDASPDLRTLIMDAFQVNKEGVDARRILALSKLSIQDERWKRAMDAIHKSLRVVSSKEHLRFYERQEDGGYKQIVLDFSKL